MINVRGRLKRIHIPARSIGFGREGGRNDVSSLSG
jgi:hypothetical protein